MLLPKSCFWVLFLVRSWHQRFCSDEHPGTFSSEMNSTLIGFAGNGCIIPTISSQNGRCENCVLHLASRGSSPLLGLHASIRAVAFERSKNKRSLMVPICLLGVSSWHWWPLYAGKCDFMLLNSIMSSCNGTVCWITAISYHLIPAIEWHQPRCCLIWVIPWLNTHNCRGKKTNHDWLSASFGWTKMMLEDFHFRWFFGLLFFFGQLSSRNMSTKT